MTQTASISSRVQFRLKTTIKGIGKKKKKKKKRELDINQPFQLQIPGPLISMNPGGMDINI